MNFENFRNPLAAIGFDVAPSIERRLRSIRRLPATGLLLLLSQPALAGVPVYDVGFSYHWLSVAGGTPPIAPGTLNGEVYKFLINVPPPVPPQFAQLIYSQQTGELADTVVYKPTSSFAGQEIFVLAIENDLTDRANLRITLDLTNTAPVPGPAISATVPAGQSSVSVDALGQAVDPDGDPLSIKPNDFTLVEGWGSLSIDPGNAANLLYTRDPGAPDETFTASFLYKVTDLASDTTNTIEFTVNGSTVAQYDITRSYHWRSVAEGTPPIAPGTHNGEAFRYLTNVPPPVPPQFGQLAFSPDTGDLAETVVYQPTSSFAGQELFTLAIENDLMQRANLQITLDLTNTAPLPGPPISATVPAGQSSLSVNALAQAVDPDGDPLVIVDNDFELVEGWGSLSIDPGNAANLLYARDPGAPNEPFTASFIYKVGDLVSSSTNTLQVSVDDSADLQLIKVSGIEAAFNGDAVVYAITVSNAGPAGVTGAELSDILPAALVDAEWACLPAESSTDCPPAPFDAGTGDLYAEIDLPAEGFLRYGLVARVQADHGTLVSNTAEVSPPAGTNDPDAGNNSATDEILILSERIFGSGFEPGEAAPAMP